MTVASVICLAIAVAAMAGCYAAWSVRKRTPLSKWRTRLAMSAILFTSFSTTLYIAFVFLWAYSHDFNGRTPLGTAAILIGLCCGSAAIVGGVFAAGLQRVSSLLSSAAVVFLWLLAAAASAVV